MKVKELITKLQEFDPELPVAVADWQEQYRNPSEPDNELVVEVTGSYFPAGSNDEVTGKFVCIGG